MGEREGHAGMAAVVVEEDFDLKGFHAHVARQLPPYARRLFLRIQTAIETTSTFKQRKVDLVREGFDPATIPDPIWFAHPEKGAYVRLDGPLHDDIRAGRIRL